MECRWSYLLDYLYGMYLHANFEFCLEERRWSAGLREARYAAMQSRLEGISRLPCGSRSLYQQTTSPMPTLAENGSLQDDLLVLPGMSPFD